MSTTQPILQLNSPVPNHAKRNIVIGIVVVIFLAFLTNAFGITTMLSDMLVKPSVVLGNTTESNNSSNDSSNNSLNSSNDLLNSSSSTTNSSSSTSSSTNNSQILPATSSTTNSTGTTISPDSVVINSTGTSTGTSGVFIGKFNADDHLQVYLNDNLIYNGVDISGQRMGWNQQHIVNIPLVKKGDIIKFAVENKWGNAGFIGTFTWNGKRYDINKSLFPAQKIYSINEPVWNSQTTLYAGLDTSWIWDANFNDLPNNPNAPCQNCVINFVWTAE